MKFIPAQSFRLRRLLLPVMGAACAFGLSGTAAAQTTVPLNDLSAFKDPPASWRIAGSVMADLNRDNALTAGGGTGILVNLPSNGNGRDLYTVAEYGDFDLELDFLMARGSNSGIYLQGRYEIQLLDSWHAQSTRPGDNGGIYQRWDESRPEGQKGYEGFAPRQNASKAPGLWQKMRISFQAPKFDAAGRKTDNAKVLRVELNGVTIHEDVELSGPTRGSMDAAEKPTGPLRIQGDHGPLAIRNIRITAFDKPRPELLDLKYVVFKGRFQDTMNLAKLPPEARGAVTTLSVSSLDNIPSEFFIQYTGILRVHEPGDYSLAAIVPGGRGILRVNNQALRTEGRGQRGTVTLPAGDLPFELLYVKNQDWTNRLLALSVSGPGIREFSVGDAISGGGNADPIHVDAPVNTMLRSFMDMPGSPRLVHTISVGSPLQVHYTYDLSKGSLAQVWRGGFLDATPMWYSRGDGSSRPLGAVQRFGPLSLTLNRLPSPDAPWVMDSAAGGLVPKGYRLDKSDLPTFRYLLYGASVEDAVQPLANGEGFSRTITLQNGSGNFYARLAAGRSIEEAGNGLYLVDDKSYYIRLDGGAQPVLREGANGSRELLVPVKDKLTYFILF